MDNFDRQRSSFRMLSEFGTHNIPLPDQKNPNIILPRGKNRALNFRLGSTIRTHGVYRYGY